MRGGIAPSRCALPYRRNTGIKSLFISLYEREKVLSTPRSFVTLRMTIGKEFFQSFLP
jgi:hypothetical protein